VEWGCISVEILYQINSLSELNKIVKDDDVIIRWLKMPEDYNLFYEHLKEQHPENECSLNECLKWEEHGTPYCGLFKNGKMVARAAAEKYLEDKWETSDVRVWATERRNGYAKQICYFVTKFILENNKIATCRTGEDNLAMQHVISALGFEKVGFV